jgi:hypothetical protein
MGVTAYQATHVGKAVTHAFQPAPAAGKQIAAQHTVSDELERCPVL